MFNSVLEIFDAKKITDIHSAVSLNPVYEVEYKGERFAPFDELFICHGMVLTNS